MIDTKQLRQGMEVYAADQEHIGTIEEVHSDGVQVEGRQIALESIARVQGDRAYLSGTAAQYRMQRGAVAPEREEVRAAEGEIRVPEIEERLEVEKRDTDLGEARIRRTVQEERQSVPVDLAREEVHVERRDVRERPAAPEETAHAFEDTTIRVPVRGEEAVARKEAVVTGEVVIDKERTTERQDVTGTVRKTHVEVDEDYQRARPGFERHFAGLRQADTNRVFQHAEPNYRWGFEAGRDERYRNRRFEDVEPDLRRAYETEATTTRADPWERLRQEVREGFDRARRG
jgi:uncharacterized protein (TIGR02271 family)